MVPADTKIIWAAYRMGGMDPQRFPEGLTRDEFLDRLSETVGSANVADVLIAARTPTRQTPFPVGIVFGATDGWSVAPRPFWFPWASKRNKLECMLAWVTERRRTHQVYFDASMAVPLTDRKKVSERRLPEHLCRYGIVDRVGRDPDYFGPDHHAMRYASIRPKN